MIVRRKAKTEIPPLAADTYGGTLIGIVDVGEQEFQGKYRRQCILVFEIDGETVEVDGEQQPRWLSRIFTASIDKKANLYSVLTSWLGGEIEDDEFNLSALLGSPAMIAVSCRTSKDGGTYNFIDGVMKPPRSMQIAPAKSVEFEFDMDEPSTYPALDVIPEWMRAMIERSPTWAKYTANSGRVLTSKDTEVQPESQEQTETTAERKPAF